MTGDTKAKLLTVVVIAVIALFAYPHLHHSSPPHETDQQSARLAADQRRVCSALGNVGSYSEWANEPGDVAAPSSQFLTDANRAESDYWEVDGTVNLPGTPFWSSLAVVVPDYNGNGGNQPLYADWLDLHELQVACVNPGAWERFMKTAGSVKVP